MDIMAGEPEYLEPEWWLNEKSWNVEGLMQGSEWRRRQGKAFVMLIHHTIRILEDAIPQVPGTVYVTSFQNVRRYFET